MTKPISKTEYIDFLSCSKNAWLKRHRPELHALFELSEFEKGLMANGNLVEEWARKLFPDGIWVKSGDEGPVVSTHNHMENGDHTLFQSTFVYDVFMARNDVLKFDPASGKWDLYEVKGTNALNEASDKIDHVEDAGFQAVVMREAGIPLGRIFLVHLNKEYIRNGDINVHELFEQEDITQQVKERESETLDRMNRAKEILLQEDENAVECRCIYAGRSGHCTTFAHSHPHVPDYSVHDISRIGNSKKRLAELIDAGILDLDDIPEDFELTDNQRLQVSVHQQRKPLIDAIAIDEVLSRLEYPLYFLDYETYPSAIPLFDGYHPYQQVPFQFSLHVLDAPAGEPAHFEYVHESGTDPSLALSKELRNCIGNKGTVIVWNKSFEQGRNKELGEQNHEYREFFADVNKRVFDLIDIFKDRHYVHPAFKGKTSIKSVLPVMVPELSYKELAIKEGGTASQKWFDAVFGEVNEDQRQQIFTDLKIYCGLDTYAMYAIWKALQST